MTVTLSEIKANLRVKIGRGTALDSSLHGYVQRAVREIERKMNWTFMYHLNTVVTELTATNPRTIRLPNVRVREIDFMRITHEDGEALEDYRVVQKTTRPEAWLPPIVGFPEEFFLVQENLLLFNNTPEYSYTLDVGWWEYTSLGTGDTTEHWLFDNAQDLIEDYATMFAAKAYRDYQRATAIQVMCSGAMNELIASEEDKQLGGEEIIMQTNFYPRVQG